MPELDGIKTLLKVRESKNIPIILISAKSEDADKILGLTAGADDYITKPFNPSETGGPRQKPAAALHPAGRDAGDGKADCDSRLGARIPRARR